MKSQVSGLSAKKAANVIPNFNECDGVRRPRFDMCFGGNSKLRTRKICVPETQTGGQEPAAAKSDIENGGVLVARKKTKGQKMAQFIGGLHDSRIISHLLPGRGRLQRTMPQTHAAIHFRYKGVGIHSIFNPGFSILPHTVFDIARASASHSAKNVRQGCRRNRLEQAAGRL